MQDVLVCGPGVADGRAAAARVPHPDEPWACRDARARGGGGGARASPPPLLRSPALPKTHKGRTHVSSGLGVRAARQAGGRSGSSSCVRVSGRSHLYPWRPRARHEDGGALPRRSQSPTLPQAQGRASLSAAAQGFARAERSHRWVNAFEGSALRALTQAAAGCARAPPRRCCRRAGSGRLRRAGARRGADHVSTNAPCGAASAARARRRACGAQARTGSRDGERVPPSGQPARRRPRACARAARRRGGSARTSAIVGAIRSAGGRRARSRAYPWGFEHGQG